VLGCFFSCLAGLALVCVPYMKCLRISDLEQKIGIKKTMIYKLMDDGVIPQPVKLGRVSMWIESEIDAAIKRLIVERSKQKSGSRNK